MPFTPPIPIKEKARRLYNLMEDLPEDSVILYIYNTYPGLEPTCKGATTAFLNHAFSKGAKIIAVAFHVLGPVMYERHSPGLWDDYEYGVDYVWLPYIAGRETGMASLLSSFRATTTTDFFGTSLDSIPLLENIDSAADIDLVAGLESDLSFGIGWIRQIYTTHGVEIAMIGGWAAMEPYYPDQISAMLFPLPGAAAEYEALLNAPGDASKQLAILYVGALFYAVFILIGGNTVNILYQIFKKEKT